jgi:ABC-type transport system involved in multi-copper enzyme maturation permease subunit
VTGTTAARVARSEAIKLLSLRSAVASYAAIGIAMVGVAGVYLTIPVTAGDAARNAALTGLLLLELLVGITGVLAAAGEYSARTIRSTFTAVPRRGRVLGAKLFVHAGLVVVLLAAATLSAVLVGALLAPAKVGSLTDGEVARALLGTAMALGGVSALGVSSGMLTRSAAGAIGILFVMMFLPVIVVVAPGVTAYLPGRAVQAVVLSNPSREAGLLAPGAAVAVFSAWLAIAVAAAAVAIRKRDA